MPYNKNKVIAFDLIKIKIDQFAMLEDSFDEKQNINLRTNIDVKVNAENKQLGVFSSFNFRQNETLILKLDVSCHFKIKEENWNSFLKGNLITFPKAFIAHLSSISVGTARGILVSKTEDTKFSKFILPLINVAEMFTEDVTFDLEER